MLSRAISAIMEQVFSSLTFTKSRFSSLESLTQTAPTSSRQTFSGIEQSSVDMRVKLKAEVYQGVFVNKN
jgi:hypothetical protein